MALDIVADYQALLKNIPQLIEISGYRSDFLAKKIGLKPANFSLKKQRGNWAPNEVEKLLQVINNEEVENYLLLELMRSRKDDKEVSYEDYKKEISTWK
ncbi:MAG: hypothetical protein M3040_14150 [Bacteroidota bacterium]|nr:hypothetical protein [Bacteroidota bacterium]